jgi:alpha-glucosidase
VLGYVRSLASERVLCAFNLSDRTATFELPVGLRIARLLDDSGARGATAADSALRFEPYGVLFAQLD